MKQHVLLLAGLFASAATFAQSKTAETGKPSVSIRAGASSASITGDASQGLNDLVDYSNGIFKTQSKLGVFAGASVNIPLGGNISVEPGLYYDQKGYMLKGSYDFKGIASIISPSAKAELNQHYISLPVLVKGNFNGFEVFAGPQVSYLAKSDLHVTAGALGFNAYNDRFNTADQFNKIDVGLLGGVGYQFANGFNIRAAYDRGLTKVDANRNMDAYNQAFKVGVGFRF
ncbi:MAG: PorT family protein [Sphingobacteriales bacterium]|nr:MAG: PorT family protein [Sphingobacteriales bacterium]